MPAGVLLPVREFVCVLLCRLAQCWAALYRISLGIALVGSVAGKSVSVLGHTCKICASITLGLDKACSFGHLCVGLLWGGVEADCFFVCVTLCVPHLDPSNNNI